MANAGLFMDGALLLGLILVVVFGIQHLIKMQRLENSRAVLKQPSLFKSGRILGWVGFVVALGGPRLLNVRYKYDDTSALIATSIYALGFALIFISFKFRISAFQTKEKNPAWMTLLLSLWSTFWRDGTE